MEDTIQVSGLAPILDEGGEAPPYLDLALQCNGAEYRAAILASEDDWEVNLRDRWGTSCSVDPEPYPTQSDAIIAAMLIVLDHSRGV